MFGQIKYSYIPKSNATEAILSSFTHAYKALDGMVSDYRLIDNIEAGIRIYPEDIQNNVMKVSKDDLLSEIDNLIKDDVDLIILNGFDIDLDEIRDDYSSLVEESEIYLCINIFADISGNNNVSISISPGIVSVDDDEWEEMKEEILEAMNEVSTESKSKDSKDKSKIKSPLEDLLELFRVSDAEEKSRKYLLDDLDVVELFSHQSNESEIYISYNTDDTVTIECNSESVDIPSNHFLFLIQSLNSIKDIKK